MAEYDIKQLKAGGFMKQKGKDLFSVRLRIVGGFVKSAQLPKLQKIADKYGRGYIHLTTRQGIEIPHVHFKDFENVKKELKEAGLGIGACGPRVRTITACQGKACSHGLIDSQELAGHIDKIFFGSAGLPHKFKIGITGCPNACIKPQENDLGIMGIIKKGFDKNLCNYCGLCAEVCPVKAIKVSEGNIEYNEKKCIGCGECVFSCPTCAWRKDMEGYRIFAGGKMGKFPKLGFPLFDFYRNLDELLNIIERLFEFYKEQGIKGERFGDTIDRLGIEYVKNKLSV
ncbi:MAG: 4Fe-4S binding protein [bacterium]